MTLELQTRLVDLLATSGCHSDQEEADVKHTFVREVVDRIVDGRDVVELIQGLVSVYSTGREDAKNEIVCDLIPSLQMRCVDRTTDLDTYARYRSRVLPVLPPALQSVWRHWDQQLPFGAAELLDG